MIDAYEIGIQLALQDGVSAGLAVIGRELAEVDQAVAASSAGLVALTRMAEGAVRAVAAAAGVAGMRAPPPVAPPVAGAAEPAVPQARDEGRAEPVAAPVVAAARQERAEPPVVRAAVQERAIGAAAAAVRRGEERVVPGASAPVRDVRTQEAGPATPGEVGVPAGSGEPARPVSAVPLAVSAPPRPAERGDAARPSLSVEQNFMAAAPQVAGRREAARSAAAVVVAPVQVVGEVAGRERAGSSHPVVMRASVAEATAGRRESHRAGHRAGRGQAVMPERVAGTAAAAERVVQMPAVTFAPGMPGPAAAAPRPAAPEREQAGGGTVMLDGRLVGSWLTDRMAREASRPPGGTSFFDPRQAPAWTPSGAL